MTNIGKSYMAGDLSNFPSSPVAQGLGGKVATVYWGDMA